MQLCIFFIPEGGVIPLHNHPDMTVFSKLLLGLMHIKSYDWVDPEASDDNMLQPQSQCGFSLLFAFFFLILNDHELMGFVISS